MRIFTLDSPDSGMQKAKEVLYQCLSSKTVLFLSGGSTPEKLYEQLAVEEKMHPAAVGMVDERFGEKWHEKSNERMIRSTGLLRYLEYSDIPWYPILQNHEKEMKKTASLYDEKVRELFFHFPKSVAILGIGADGHTAGIPAATFVTETAFDTSELAVGYEDEKGIYGQRITMSFTALSMIDTFIILAFGKDKKQALKKMFTQGSMEEIPARFYNKPDISKKVTLITDQII